MASTVTIGGTLQAVTGGTLTYAPAAATNNNAIAQAYELTVGTSAVEVTLPANTLFYGVQPVSGNTVLITHRWNSSDVGGSISKSFGLPCVAVDPSNLMFWLVAASSTSVTIWTW